MIDAKEIADILLELDAVSISVDQPFRWASGLNAPIYCDNRTLISFVKQREIVRDAFVDAIKGQAWEPSVIAGTATAGIPHAAWIAEAMKRPMVYVRGAAKGHGKRNQLEGTLPPNAQVVLVEDLISTGTSSLNAARAIQESGAQLLGIVAIFEYGLKRAETAFREAGIKRVTLTQLDILLAQLERRGGLSPGIQASFRAWQDDPVSWSDQHG